MTSPSKVYVHVDRIDAATSSAFLCRVDEVGLQVWLPRSQILDHEDYKAGNTDVDLATTEELANAKGLGAVAF